MKKDVSARNRLHVDERRAQLLQLAMELFTGREYDDISIGEIAEAAGISKGLLYHYFPSKRAFFTAAVEEASRQLLDATEIDRPDSPHDPGAIRARIDAYLVFAERHSAQYVLVLRSRLDGAGDVRATVDRTRQAFIDRFASTLGATLGGPVSERVEIAIHGFVGFVEAASLAWLERADTSREEMSDMLTQICVATFACVLQGAAP